MRRVHQILAVSLTLGFISLSTSCKNAFEGLSKKDTDQALFEDARKAANNQDYSTAISKYEQMSSDFLSGREVRKAYAGALAGKCGMEFFPLLESLSQADFSSNTVMGVLMTAFKQQPVSADHCRQAEAMMMSLSSSGFTLASLAEFSAGEKFFLLLIAISKIGTYLRENADQDSTDNLGDGAIDAGFDVCAPAQLSDTAVANITSGFAMVLQTITAFSTSFGSSATSAFTQLSALCDPPLSLGFCSLINPENIDASTISAFRDLLATGTGHPTTKIGIGTCVDPIVTNCCP